MTGVRRRKKKSGAQTSVVGVDECATSMSQGNWAGGSCTLQGEAR